MREVERSLNGIHEAIIRELKRHIEPQYRSGAQKYVKEGIVLYGVRTRIVRDISAKYYRKIREAGRNRVLALSGFLVQSRYAEEKTIAFDWAYRIRRQYEPNDFRLFESWLSKYVRNWGSCDDLCRHAFGAFIHEFPQFLPHVFTWTTSRNRWLRRGAAVIMIYSLRKGEHLEYAFRIADALLHDDDYLVQNGYGWMLKDASILFPEMVFEYMMKHRAEMPRRALRYAIERLSNKRKKRAMN